MFEYMNYGGLGILLFIGIVIFTIDGIGKKKEISWGSYISIVVITGLLVFDARTKETDASNNIKDFQKKNLTLKCIVGGGLYSIPNKYRVSKSDGWSLDKEYFIKNSLMVKVSQCERW